MTSPDFKNLKTMNKILTLLSLVIIIGCESEPQKYKHVCYIKSDSKTYPVTVTEKSNNMAHRAAGGALIGWAVGFFTGHSILKTSVAGGLIGAATSDGETATTYTKMQTDITYTIAFDDCTKWYSTNYLYLHKGDSVLINTY